MQKLNILALGLTTFIFAAGCGQKGGPTKLSENNPIIQGSVIKKDEATKGDTTSFAAPKSYHIELKKSSAFEQKFLLSTAIISGAPSPTGSAAANKIVFFERKGPSVFLFESSQGKVLTNTLESKNLLAEFSIVKEDEKTVTINFKEGMGRLFYKRSMFNSDYGDNIPADDVLKVVNNYIEDVELRGEHLFIDQIARVETLPSPYGEVSSYSVHLKYTLTSYEPKNEFPSKKTPKQHRVGFFEIHPTLEAGSGEKTINIMKYDEREPITYSITQNTPKEYRQAVKDGVLYWNKAFGEDIVKVQDLPQNVSVHEPGYNIVQWLNWDNAGFAYANMQGDPLTGEILQSHVYLTSAFTTGKIEWAKDKYRLWVQKGKPKKSKHNTSLDIGLKGFSTAHHCQFGNYHHSMQALGKFLQNLKEAEAQKNLTKEEKDKAFKQFTKDYLRSTVAHEVGHTMGLRHNFAGSLTTTLTRKNWPEKVQAYFEEGKLAESDIPTGTVMDYNTSMVSAMNGAYIRTSKNALPYDQQAIQWAYSDKELEPKEFITFCTDTHKGKYIDCRAWDQFSNLLESNQEDWLNVPKKLGYNLAKNFAIISGSDNPGDISDKISQVDLYPTKAAEESLEEWKWILEFTHKDAGVRSLRIDYPQEMSAFDKREYKERVRKLLGSMTHNRGGNADILLNKLKLQDGKTRIANQILKEFEEQFHKLYPEATRAEWEMARDKVHEYLDFYEKELLKRVAKELQRQKYLIGGSQLAKQLSQWVESLLFKKSDNVLVDGKDGKLYSPFYGFDLRKEVANVLENHAGLTPSFVRALNREKEKLSKKHDKEQKILLDGREPLHLPDKLFNVFWEEKEIFSPMKNALREYK